MASSLHLVGYSERDGPHLLGLGPDGARRIDLAGDFRWTASRVRWCVGSWTEAGHVPCPTGAVVGDGGQCLPCSGLEHPDCIFEPLCANAPESCGCAQFRGQEHVVYIAFHGLLPKVGMTMAWRVARRLREQGADAYFVVRGGMDRPGARLLEKQVSLLHDVPEHRNHHEILPQLARAVPWDAVRERAEAWRARLSAEHRPGPFTTIVDHPVAQPLPSRPRRVVAWGTHAGTWLGAKGNDLFYREAPRPGRLELGAPPVAAVKRTDLLGRRVTLADGDRSG
jgi:hypothetical protein